MNTVDKRKPQEDFEIAHRVLVTFTIGLWGRGRMVLRADFHNMIKFGHKS